jgi:3-oxoadipate enol-lactonase
MPLADLGNVKIYYEEHGEGEPVFFLPGYSSDISWWDGVVAFLKPFYRAILLDYRGGGRSVNTKPFSIRDLADDTVKVMDHLKIKKASFVGHSMGGTIAQDLAAFHPDRIHHLCLVCSLPYCHPTTVHVLKTGLKLRQHKEIPVDLMFDIYLPWVLSGQFMANSKSVEEYKKYLLSNPHPPLLEGLTHRWHAIVAFDSRPYLKTIHAKTLIVATKRDLLVPFPDTETLVKHISGSKLLIIQDEGHNPLLEAPEKLAKSIREFLA